MAAHGERIVIVAAEFNKGLVDQMVEVARAELVAGHALMVRVVRVSGCYEIPLIADREMADEETDALVVLGFIERGETLHGEVMGHVVNQALVQLQLKYHKPAGIGIIGPGATAEQAELRKHESARSAVHAALRSCRLLSSPRAEPRRGESRAGDKADKLRPKTRDKSNKRQR
jgi:6,7-dimethyl-8-ribityllumazine synthase